MKCSEFDKYIHDHVDGCLDIQLSGAMDEHARSCTHCRQALNCEVKSVEALSSIRQDRTPPYVLRDVLDRVQPAANNKRFSWGIVGSALLVIATVLTVPFLRAPNHLPMISGVGTRTAVNRIDRTAEASNQSNETHLKIARNELGIKSSVIDKPHKKLFERGHIEKSPAAQRSLISEKKIPSTRYLVVMTPVLDTSVPAFTEDSATPINKLDSSYSIQVEDKDTSTLTNLSVTNEITPEMQPKNTVEYSITNTAPPVDNVEPERSFNNENNRSINCLDSADGIG